MPNQQGTIPDRLIGKPDELRRYFPEENGWFELEDHGHTLTVEGVTPRHSHYIFHGSLLLSLAHLHISMVEQGHQN